MDKPQPLLSPVKLGPYELPSRIVMAAMTSARADNSERTPTDLHVDYYAQRAGAGLVVAEAAQISPQAIGHVNTPGIYSEAQVAAWKRVTEAVHARGGRIFLQLLHVGRLSHPDFHDGALPVAPSAINPGTLVFTSQGMRETVTPHALSTREVRVVVQDYVRAAENAIRAGFDGIELDGANGYLIEQFLRDSSNRRMDRYGGGVAARARFLFEIVEGISEKIGSERLGVRLSPANVGNIPADSDTTALYDFVIGVLDGYRLAYLHLAEASDDTASLTDTPEESVIARYRTVYRGTLIANGGYDRDRGNAAIANGGYDRDRGNAAIANGEADLIAYDRPFVANPDLPERFRLDAPLAEADREAFYQGSAKGYTDCAHAKTEAA